ncbi:MAG: hypothetical protein J6Y99_09050 [Bacteroidales bacterium]|nr:hypothetical protein [Bacteroidales bacterium]
MKQTRLITVLLACLLPCLVGVAQNTIVVGTNLNIGENNILSSDLTGTKGHAIGRYNIVGSHNSLAVGHSDTINDASSNSLAVGTSNKVGGCASFALGHDVKVMGDYSLGVGRFLKTSEDGYCMVIGNGFQSTGLKPKKYLENSYSYSLMIGFKSIPPTLTVGPSPNDYPTGDTLGKTGKIAIGDVPVPDIAAKLHIRSDYGEDASLFLEPKDKENSSTFIKLKDEDHGIEVDNEGELTVSSMNGGGLGSLVLNGRVGINISNESEAYVLAVRGGILTDEVFIKNVDEWFDHVFAKDYELMSLHDLHCYINNYGHLPEVPAETIVLNEGFNMGELQGILLKKIEELTLYTIEQQQQIERLEQRINELERK